MKLSQLNKKINSLFTGKKGNTLLLASAAAIASAFSIYFFTALTELSEEKKQKITHLYNSYQMGLAVRGHINGTDQDLSRLGASTKDDIESSGINRDLVDGGSISLASMVSANFILVQKDPTVKSKKYDTTASKASVIYLDASGSAITDGSTVVESLKVLVNLAGTDNGRVDNAPYAAGSPFFYVLMFDDAAVSMASGTVADSLTIETDADGFTEGILDITNGGPQPETSVRLPI